MTRTSERCNMLGKLEKRTVLEGSKKVIKVTLPSSFEQKNILTFKSIKRQTHKKELIFIVQCMTDVLSLSLCVAFS